MKHQNIEDIIRSYSKGAISLDAANAALKDAGAAIHIDPHRTDLTPEEVLHTTTGNTPAEANGWGLLDTGTGSLDKVEVGGGQLANMDCGQMHALCIIGGKTYQVKGDTLTD